MPSPVEGVRPEVEMDSLLDLGDSPAARMTGTLEDDDLAALPRDQGGRHQTGQSAADNDQVHLRITTVRGLHG